MFSALMPAIAQGLGNALGGGSSPPPAPQKAESAVYGSGYDGSGWSVNFSGVQAGISPVKSGDGTGMTGGFPSLLLIGGAVVLVFFLARKKS